MSSIGETQEAILTYLRSAIPQPIIEQGIPDINTVKRNRPGDIDPYVAIQFGDLQNGVGKSFVGPRGHDYQMPIYTQVIAPEPGIARRIQNKVVDALLGEGFPWSGQIEKRPGGAMFPMTNSNGATEAYTAPSSFGLLVQFE